MLGIEVVGHRLRILKALHALKREQGLRFEEGDYIPLGTLPSMEFVSALGEHLEILKSLVSEKGFFAFLFDQKIP
jgi:hypothetical protein